jgi:hypothetical protein
MRGCATKRVRGVLLPLFNVMMLAACGGGEVGSSTSSDQSAQRGMRGEALFVDVANPLPDAGTVAERHLHDDIGYAQRLVVPLAANGAPLVGGEQSARGQVSGCTPSLYSDYIDGDTWNNRRLVPVDCAIMEVQAPLFSWRQPYDRDDTKPWTLTVRRKSGETVFSTQLMQTRLQLRQLLDAGDYTWTVSYKRDRGERETITSAARRFNVPVDAAAFLPPEGSVLAAQVARKSRPHVLPAGASFATIAGRANGGEYAQRYKAFIKGADKVLGQPIPVEPLQPNNDPKSKAYKDWKRKMTGVTRAERKNILTLAFAWRFTGKANYRDAARNRVVELAKWSPTGGSSHESNSLANSDIFGALALALDLLDGDLSDSQRKSIVASVKARVAPAPEGFAALDQNPYDSLNLESLREVVNALLYAAGSFPEAESWLADAWDLYTETIATWGGDDGSWGNGNGYGWNMLDGFGEVLANVRLTAGVDLSQSSWVRRVGDTLIAQTAPAGKHMSAFGDDAEDTESYSMYAKDLYRLYAAVTRLPHQVWYWKVGDALVSENTIISPFHFMLLALDQPEVVAAAETRTSFHFPEAGVVAMHDNAAATDRSSVFFRSSRFGSFNHSHADQNAFTLVSKGNDVLITGGYYPYYMSKHHATVTRATRYKNALTFDGGIGQAEPVKSPTAPGKPMASMDTRGEMINYRVSGKWAAATGDATLAYRGWDSKADAWLPLLSNAVRSIGYNRQERVIVIYDWATSDVARRWELNFNSLEPFTANGASAKATGKTASACIDIHGGSGSFSTSKGFAVAPEGNYPTQYQARYKAGGASNEWVAVTIVRESCSAVPVTVDLNGLSAVVRVNGEAALSFSGRTVTLP